MRKRRLAFIKSGHFSHINVAIRDQLITQFPDLKVEQIDVWDDILGRRHGVVLTAIGDALLRYPQKLITSRSAIRSTILRTPFLFRRLRKLIGERLKGRLSEYQFAFQTQSLFDASVPGLPHFVFTDHTHLANLRYPAVRQSSLFPAPWASLEPQIYQHARHIFVMSEHVRDSLREDYGIAPDRVTTVFGGSNVAPFSGSLENDGYRNRTVVFVGVDWERKGGATLAQAFEQVHSEVPDARLVVVGCLPGLGQPWCEELGKLPREEVRRHLARSSVFCLPTLVEPFGIAVVEAFHHRLPAVVTNVGAMPSLVRHGESGLIVPPGNAAALAEALRTLLLAPEKCRQFGEAGYQDVHERCSWPAVGGKLRDGILQSLGEH